MIELDNSHAMDHLSPDTIKDIFDVIEAEKETSDPDYWKKRYESLLATSIKHLTALQDELRRVDLGGVKNLYFPQFK